jgi:uncharacterized BrkB/YihY/UPF0761 family membrane protein
MIGERTILFFEKAGIFLVALAIVVFATIALAQWSDPFKDFFWKTGRWEEFIILTIFVLGIGYILRWLLKLAFRIEAGVKKRRR